MIYSAPVSVPQTPYRLSNGAIFGVANIYGQYEFGYRVENQPSRNAKFQTLILNLTNYQNFVKGYNYQCINPTCNQWGTPSKNGFFSTFVCGCSLISVSWILVPCRTTLYRCCKPQCPFGRQPQCQLLRRSSFLLHSWNHRRFNGRRMDLWKLNWRMDHWEVRNKLCFLREV